MSAQEVEERIALFELVVAIQVRHWPKWDLWLDFTHPLRPGYCRVYPDGSYEL